MPLSTASISNKQRRERPMVASSMPSRSIMRSLLSVALVSLVLASTVAASAIAPVIATTTSASHQSHQHQNQHPNQHERQLRYGLKERSSSPEISQSRSLQTDANTQFVTNFSEDGDGSTSTKPKHRVDLAMFKIVMTPAPYELDVEGEDEFHRLLERVIFNYISEMMTRQIVVGSEETLELQYVLLGDIESEYTPGDRRVRHLQEDTSDGSTTLTFADGVVSFVGSGTVPSENQVNIWVQQAIDTSLVQYLQEQDTIFYYVGDSTFIADPVPISQPDEASSASSDDNNVGMIAGIAVACVVGVALMGMFVARRKFGLFFVGGSGRRFDQEVNSVNDSDMSKQKGGDADTVNESYETDGSPTRNKVRSTTDDVYTPADNKQQQEQQHVYDADAGSVSDFTVQTEAGDTTALKTINTKQIMVVVPAMVNSESFERERPVNIRKDMLTSAWSGRANGKRSNHNESVLQPSHFTASAERRVRRQEQDFDPDPTWNPEDDSVEFGTSNASPFVFEQAHESPSMGEEIYLMPPSQQARARTQSPAPEIL